LTERQPEFVTSLFVDGGCPAEEPAGGELQSAQLVIEVINPCFLAGTAHIIRMLVDTALQPVKIGDDVVDWHSWARDQGFGAAPRFDEVRIVLRQG
jgi:hypothetical protein